MGLFTTKASYLPVSTPSTPGKKTEENNNKTRPEEVYDCFELNNEQKQQIVWMLKAVFPMFKEKYLKEPVRKYGYDRYKLIDYCTHVLKLEIDLDQYQITSRKPFKCSQCQTRFKNKQDQRHHEQTTHAAAAVTNCNL